jgi:two-component system chemotaxis sensor kinase CheA
MKTEDYKDLYIEEAEEILDSFENGVLSCEENGKNIEQVEELFRCAHNLKGISGAMGYEPIVESSHRIENTLDKLKKGEINFSGDKISLLLQVSDFLRELVQGVTQGGECDCESLSGNIADLMNTIGRPCEEGSDGTDGGNSGTVHVKAADGNILGATNSRQQSRITSIKVELEKLDKIMDLVGELIISGIRLRERARKQKEKNLLDELEATERLISEIQKDVMEVRLVPVGHVFRRFKRVVRDTAMETGKKVKLITFGEHIGLGRTVLEGMVDPIVHIIRNAVDHGIEPPKEREKAGKPGEGVIRLSARRERNFVIIEVTDDGYGIDVKKVTEKMKDEHPDEFLEDDLRGDKLAEMLAAPGFSTSEKVSRISGRGMGMNIVKKAVDSFGGTFDIESKVGVGTTIYLKLPVNLSIIKSLMFQLGHDIHAIPLEYVMETARVESNSFSKIRGKDVLRWGDETISVFKPWEVLDFDYHREKNRFEKLVIVKAEGNKIGVIVDRIIGQQDVVVKGLPAMMKGDTGILGATVLGSGEIAFIWDSRVFSKGKVNYESDTKTVVSAD